MKNSLDTIKIVKKVLKDKDPIIKNLGSKLKVTYKGKKSQPRPIILPKYIQINEKLGELCGLYYGEGATSKNSWTSHIQFTNSEPSLVKYFLMLIEEIFEFERDRFMFRIRGGNEKIETLSKDEIIKIWKRSFNLYIFILSIL